MLNSCQLNINEKQVRLPVTRVIFDFDHQIRLIQGRHHHQGNQGSCLGRFLRL